MKIDEELKHTRTCFCRCVWEVLVLWTMKGIIFHGLCMFHARNVPAINTITKLEPWILW